jgi:hypothetical protein
MGNVIDEDHGRLATGVSHPGCSPRTLTGSRSLAAVFNSADLRDRLRKIRPIALTFAEELETARRQATRLGTENRRALEEVRRLQKQRGRVDPREDKHRA